MTIDILYVYLNNNEVNKIKSCKASNAMHLKAKINLSNSLHAVKPPPTIWF